VRPYESFDSVTVSRTELVVILAITLTGVAARFAFLDELAIEHFDEGVYASNLLIEGGSYPDRFLYAPPLVPFLIEWSMIIFGPARWAPFLPSLILGSLTVPLAWWSVRRWANGPAGIAAAALISLSDFHVAMSRSALTDTPMVFFLLLAVWLTVEALSDRNGRLAVVAGFVTGLAWATKYNGWLPIAVAISGAGAAWVFWPRSKPGEKPEADGMPLSSIVACLAVLVVTAVTTWFPVWWELQPFGGYARVADNHSNYVTGFSEWWPAAVRHEAVQRHYAGWPTLISGWLAVVAAAVVLRVERSTWNELLSCHDLEAATSDAVSGGGSIEVSRTVKQDVKRSTWNDENDAVKRVTKPGSTVVTLPVERSTWNESAFIFTVVIAAALTGAIMLSPVVALGVWSLTELVATALTLRRNQKRSLRDSPGKAVGKKRGAKVGSKDATEATESSSNNRTQRRWFGVWLHLAWLCGLILATPLYQPYPRLALPLLCVGYVGTGIAVVRLLCGKRTANLAGLESQTSATGPPPSDQSHSDETLNDGASARPHTASESPESAVAAGPSRLRFIWLAAIVFLCVRQAISFPGGAWQDRSALADIASQAIAAAAVDCKDARPLKGNFTFVMYAYGEPGLVFHVSSHGAPILPIMDLSFAMPGSSHSKIPTYVLAGPHAWQSSQFGDQLRELPDGSLVEIDEFPYQVSDFVLLDDQPPRLLSKFRHDVVKLYRVQFQ